MKKSNLKKLLAFVLVLTALMGHCFALEVTAEDEDNSLWAYHNSLLVTVNVPEEINFTPDDFQDDFVDFWEDIPDAYVYEESLKYVYIVSKQALEEGFRYELVLMFSPRLNYYYMNRLVRELEYNSIVEKVERNKYVTYDKEEGYVALNETVLWLEIGEEATLFVTDSGITDYPYEFYGVEIEVDPTVIDPESITNSRSLYEEYGILLESATPCRYGNIGPVYEVHMVVRDTSKDEVAEEIADSDYLSRIEGIVSSNVLADRLHGGSNYEYWRVENSDVAYIMPIGGFCYAPEVGYLCQDCLVTGVSVGVTYVSIARNGVEGVCVVHVYDSKDVNNDGYVDSADAARLLRYDMGLEDSELATYDRKLSGDANGDGKRDSADAALILAYDLGL